MSDLDNLIAERDEWESRAREAEARLQAVRELVGAYEPTGLSAVGLRDKVWRLVQR